MLVMLKWKRLINHWVSSFGFFYLPHMFKVHPHTQTQTRTHSRSHAERRRDEAALCLAELPTTVMCSACCRHTAGSCVGVKRSHAGWGYEPRSATPTRFPSMFHPLLESSLFGCRQPYFLLWVGVKQQEIADNSPKAGWGVVILQTAAGRVAYCLTWSISRILLDCCSIGCWCFQWSKLDHFLLSYLVSPLF